MRKEISRADFIRAGLIYAGLPGTIMMLADCSSQSRKKNPPDFSIRRANARNKTNKLPKAIINKIENGLFLSFNDIKALCGNSEAISLLKDMYAIDLQAIRSSLSAPNHNMRGNPAFKKVCFSFDCGGKPGNIIQILDTLKRFRLTTTFFLTGEFIDRYPFLVSRIVEEGHEVGNHSDTHPRFRSRREIRREILNAQKKFKKITGRHMAPYFRPPYLQELGRSWIIDEAAKVGYICVNATVAVNDWTWRSHKYYVSKNQFISGFKKLDFKKLGICSGRRKRVIITPRFVRYTRKRTELNINGAIFLLHAFSYRKKEFISDALEILIPFLHSKGYAVGSVTELLNDAWV